MKGRHATDRSKNKTEMCKFASLTEPCKWKHMEHLLVHIWHKATKYTKQKREWGFLSNSFFSFPKACNLLYRNLTLGGKDKYTYEKIQSCTNDTSCICTICPHKYVMEIINAHEASGSDSNIYKVFYIFQSVFTSIISSETQNSMN